MISSRIPAFAALMLAAALAGCRADRVREQHDSAQPAAGPGGTTASAPSPDSSGRVPAPPVRDSVPAAAARPARRAAAAQPPVSPPAATPRHVSLGDIDLTGVGYDVGSRAAPVVVIDFSDFGCPYCGQFTRETYPAIEREYVKTGKVFFKYVPFVAGMFPNGQQAALAAECAADQGRFWPMHAQLYAHQAEWKKAPDPTRLFQGYAGALALDSARFGACYAGQKLHPRTRRANEIANDIGVRVTPSFIVNERPVEGALPIADFRRVLDAALLLAAEHR